MKKYIKKKVTYLPLPKCSPLPLQVLLTHTFLSRKTMTYFLSLQISLQCLEFYLGGSIQYVLFAVPFSPLRIIILRYIHIAVCINCSFFLLQNNISLYICTTICLAIYLLMDTWIISNLGLLQRNYNKYSCASFCVDICFYFSRLVQNGWFISQVYF